MGKDVGWKEFFSDNSRYADIVNGIGCKGEQIVTEYDLQEVDTQMGMKYRDCIRKVAFGIHFAIVGIENQETIDYSIPVRSMTYDANAYSKQVADIRKEVRKSKERLDVGEYLYGFRKSDKLYPVVTFVLYADAQPWDGATRLHEILNFEEIPEELQNMVPDYKVNLINIRALKDTSVFQTDVRQVFNFIRCANDKKALKELVESDAYYQHMKEDAFDIATQYTKAKELIVEKEKHEKEGGIDMCKALTELIEDGRIEGREEGREEGRRTLIVSALKNGRSALDISSFLGLSLDEVETVEKETMQLV